MKKYLKYIVGILFYLLIDSFVSIVFTKLNIDYNNLSLLKKNILLIFLGIFKISCFIFIFYKELKTDYKIYKKEKGNYFYNYFHLYVLGVVLMGITNSIISKYTNMKISENEETIRHLIKTMPIYISFSTIIYAPFVEELIYRKCFRGLISNKYLFIILSGSVFGLMHVISGNQNINDILMGIPYIIIGLDFAYIYYKTNNIFATMQFHFLHNLLLFMIQIIL